RVDGEGPAILADDHGHDRGTALGDAIAEPYEARAEPLGVPREARPAVVGRLHRLERAGEAERHDRRRCRGVDVRAGAVAEELDDLGVAGDQGPRETEGLSEGGDEDLGLDAELRA